MTKDEASAVYVAHSSGMDVPVEKYMQAVKTLEKEGVLIR